MRRGHVWCVNRKLFAAAVLLLAAGFPLKAQYIGDQQMGLAGVGAGTMPAPGLYVTIPLYYRFSDISIYGAQGNRIAPNATAAINLYVLPAVEYVTPFKILGATYGAAFTEWVNNGEVNLAALNFSRSSAYTFGDIYVQPLILGWHLPRGDVTAGYSFFAPTGSAGQHMWVNEIDLGGTFYPTAGKEWNVSTMMYYDFNGTKNNTNVKVGRILTLAGGIGRSFLKGAGKLGVAYGAQWKTTRDSGPDIPAFLPLTNGRIFGVGPEVGMPVFAKGPNIGLVSFRYLWTAGAKTALGGHILAVSFTFARINTDAAAAASQ